MSLVKNKLCLRLSTVFLAFGFWLLFASPAFATVEVITAASSSPWTAPTNVYSVTVECWGGGGGGAGDGTNDSSGVAGGGGGAYAKSTVSVTPASTYSFAVGAAGAGGTGGTGGPGGSGGSTSFNTSSCIAPGGGGGTGSAGGAGTGGAGGSGATGNVTTTNGTTGNAGSGTTGGSGGKGGNNTDPLVGTAGTGATNGNNGGAASPYASGGGGSGNRSGGAEVGGAGSAGVIRLTYSTTVTYSGTVYTDAGNSTTSEAFTVKLAVGTSTPPTIYSTTTNSNGNYFFDFNAATAGITATTSLVIWVDGHATTSAVTVTRASGLAPITGLDLWKNHVISRHESTVSTSSLSIANFAMYDNSNDSDIPYTATTTGTDTLTVLGSSTILYIWGGDTFAPNGNVNIQGSLKGGTSATYTGSTTAYTLTLTGTTTGLTVGPLLGNVGDVVFNGSGGGWDLYNFGAQDFTVTNGTVTLQSGTLSVNGDFTNNGTFTNPGGTLSIAGAAYDISQATFDSIAFDVSGQETNPTEMLFNDDGTILYVMGYSDDDINAYPLNTAYDIGSGTSSPSSIALSVVGEEDGPTDMLFNNDGTILYVIGTFGDDINAYPLDTAYDISSYTSGTSIALSVAGEEDVPNAMLFNDDGTILYVMGSNGDDINAYPLPTPYDISSYTSGTSIALSVAGEEANPRAMLWGGDGTILYVMGDTGDDINAYPLNTAYDIGSGTSSPSTIALSVAGQETNPRDMLFNDDGTILYVLGLSGDDINAYTMQSNHTVSGTLTGSSNLGNVTIGGGASTTFANNASTSGLTISSGGQLTAPSQLTIDGEFTQNGTFEAGSGTVYLEGAKGYDISLATFDSIALSISGQESTPTTMLFNQSGTILYVMGSNDDDINAYPLTTPYDPSSYTSGTSIVLDVSGQEADPTDLLFNDDGTILYVMGFAGQDINAYPLPTPYDISSYTSGTSIALDVSGEDTTPYEMLFNDDGTILYVLGTTGKDINAYPLPTAYDISSYTSGTSIALSVSVQESSPTTMLFNDDGTILYVMGSNGDDINAYPLPTAYDISSYISGTSIALDVSGEETGPRDMLFNQSGTVLYVMGSTGLDINAYTIPATVPVVHTGTFTGSSSLNNVMAGAGIQQFQNDLELAGDLTVDGEIDLNSDAAALTMTGTSKTISGSGTTTLHDFTNTGSTTLSMNLTLGGDLTQNGTFVNSSNAISVGSPISNRNWTEIGGDGLNSSWASSTRDTVQAFTAAGGNVYAAISGVNGDGEVWEWDGSSWTMIGGDAVNSSWADSIYEDVFSLAASGTTVYAGLGASAGDAEVWEYNGSSWTMIGGDAVNSSWADSTYNWVYELTVANGLVYAALGSNTVGDAEVWSYNGSSWTKIGGDSVNSSWADSSYERAVSLTADDDGNLYAGLGVGSADAEVWEWNGSSWTMIGGDSVNSSWSVAGGYERVESLAAANGRLYAGLGQGTGDAEVWEFNGTDDWTKIGGDSVNSSWSNSAYVFSLLTAGGNVYAGLGILEGDGEVWEWDGSSWTKLGGDGVNSSWATADTAYSLFNSNGKFYAGLGNDNGDAAVWEIVDNISTFSGTLNGTSQLGSVNLVDSVGVTFASNATTSDLSVSSTSQLTLATSTSITGDYTNNGTVIFSDSGTTTFAGTSLQTATGTMTGDSELNNVVITNTSGTDATTTPSVIFGTTASSTGNLTINTPGVMVQFADGATTTWQNLNITGASGGNNVYLYSASSTGEWYVDVIGTSTIEYAQIKDSNAGSNTSGTIYASSSIDAGNNTNWSFTAGEGGGGGGSTVTWDGDAADGLWESPTNWSGDTLPDADSDVVIDIATTVSLNTATTVNSLALGSSTASVASVLSFDYNATATGAFIVDDGDLIIYNGASITHATGSVNGSITGNISIDVQTGDLTINSGGSIDVSEAGYDPGAILGNGAGPGAGQSSGSNISGGGGAYGGDGGDSSDAQAGGSAYGSTTYPAQLGSSGGGHDLTTPGEIGVGGGLAILTVTGTTTIDGSILANGGTGLNGSQDGAGGGSGGGINLTTGGLEGTGSVTANGGAGGDDSNDGGGGGGGRIAIQYTTGSTTNLTLQAFGGAAFGSADDAAAGTIFTKADNETNGNLTISNNGNTTELSTLVELAALDTLIATSSAIAEFSSTTGSSVTITTVEIGASGNFIVATGTTLSYTTLDIGNNGILTERGIINFPSTYTVPAGGEVRLDRARSFTDLIINGVLSHSANTTTQEYILNIDVTNDLTINSGGSINVSEAGYDPGLTLGNGAGPGAGQSSGSNISGGGGAYGGDGGDSSDAQAGGSAYGSTTYPAQLGSSGGGHDLTNPGEIGVGGGLAILTVTGTTTIDGSILANGGTGLNGSQDSAGGGSGGGVNITTGGLEGTGSVTANGGDGGTDTNDGGGGGGGRIAINFTTGSTSNITLEASGGTGPDTAEDGAPGTIFTKAAAQTYGDVLFTGNGNTNELKSARLEESSIFDSVVATNTALVTIGSSTLPTFTTTNLTAAAGANLIVATGTTLSYTTLDIGNNGILTERGTINFPSSFTVEAGGEVRLDRARSFTNLTVDGVLSHSANTTTQEYILNIDVTNDLTVNSGGSINVSEAGYDPGLTLGNGAGPGAGESSGSNISGGGGAYGGDGGDSSDAQAGGSAYGSTTNPVQLGSSGGGHDTSQLSAGQIGVGGGLAILTVTGTTTIDGSILANGGTGLNGAQDGAGGGSGGGINLTTGGLEGTGSVTANGGDGGTDTNDGGGGGGGRIAIQYTTGSTTALTLQAFGATGPDTAEEGAAGTIFTKSAAQTYGDLLIDNNSVVTNIASTPLATGTAAFSLDSLTVSGSASATVPTTLTLYGDYTNTALVDFSANGTTTFAGTAQQTATGTMTGTSAFNNVEVTNTSGTDAQSAPSVVFGAASEFTDFTAATDGVMVQFKDGATTTMTNLVITGSASDYVYLYSTDAGTQWNIDVTGTESVDYVYVKDSNACSSTGGNIPTTNSVDSNGNNSCWDSISAFEEEGGATGSSTLSDHDATQVSNAFNFQNKTNEALFAFKLTPESGNATVTDTVITLSGAKKVDDTYFSNVRLYRDVNDDAAYDGGDVQVGGDGVMSLASEESSGDITFTGDFLITAANNYILVADWNAPPNGTFLVFNLNATDLSIVDDEGAQDVTGSVDAIQHSRNNKGGGGNSLGDEGVPGAGIVTGGTNDGGEELGGAPNFNSPTTDGSPHDEWTGGGNAYASDGSYASETTNSDRQSYATFGYNIPSGNQIDGIAVKLEASALVGTGTIQVALSWDSGASVTTAKTTAELTGTDTIYTLGGSSDTWGRAWDDSEFTNSLFRVRLIGQPSPGGTVQVDAISVRIYNSTSGGGSGGGSGEL